MVGIEAAADTRDVRKFGADFQPPKTGTREILGIANALAGRMHLVAGPCCVILY